MIGGVECDMDGVDSKGIGSLICVNLVLDLVASFCRKGMTSLWTEHRKQKGQMEVRNVL